VEGSSCLEECVEAGRGFWGRAGRQAQVAQNLADHRKLVVIVFVGHIGIEVATFRGKGSIPKSEPKIFAYAGDGLRRIRVASSCHGSPIRSVTKTHKTKKPNP